MTHDANAPAVKRNQRDRAVALQYQDSSDLPKVIATGAGEIAREILRIAHEHRIPIEQDSTLSDMLSNLNVGASISPESFRLVAEIVCYLYSVDERFRQAHQSLKPLLADSSD